MIEHKVKQDFPLAQYSTYKIGGPAEFFISVAERAEVEAAWAWAKERNLAVTVLGGGSNVLISDNGIKGLVIHLDNQKLEITETQIIAGAGLEVKKLSELAYEQSLSGLEWAIGIPGSVGGAIRGNAGAHGGSFDKVVQNVTVFNSEDFNWHEFKTENCGFAYRHSIFKEQPHLIVWETSLHLEKGDKAKMKEQIEPYREYRRSGQPHEPSAGCIFKNLFAEDVKQVNPELYARAEAEGKIKGGKIGAGYLVTLLNLKGYSQGGAKISEQHANFIVNVDHAKAQDVLDIAEKVKRDVRAEFGIDFEEEVQRLGF